MRRKRLPNSGSFGYGSPYTRQPLDPSVLEITLSLLNENKSLREIAKILNKSPRTVSRYVRALREAGRVGYLQEQYPPLTQEQLSRAKELLEDRSGYDEAARTVGCTPKTLHKHLPGYALTTPEIIERARSVRVFESIPNHL